VDLADVLVALAVLIALIVSIVLVALAALIAVVDIAAEDIVVAVVDIVVVAEAVAAADNPCSITKTLIELYEVKAPTKYWGFSSYKEHMGQFPLHRIIVMI
jgi:hypothetical protein